MNLYTDGSEIPLRGGRALLSAEYTPGDRGPGLVRLTSQDQVTGDLVESAIRLDRWRATSFDVYEWVDADVLVICGSPSIVAVQTSTLRLGSAFCLEYEEGDTIKRPWFVPSDHRLLVVATPRHAWAIDHSAAIRWTWACQQSTTRRWISGAPWLVGREVHVPVETVAKNSVAELGLDDGIEAG